MGWKHTTSALSALIGAVAALRCGGGYSARDDASAANSGHDDAEAPPPPDDDAGTAIELPDGGLRVDGGDGGCPQPCDCDGDGWPNATCPPGDGGLHDCDDLDPFIHPGQDTFISSPWDTASPHTPAGDWNCNGQRETQYSINVSCGGACTGSGFEGDPACGTEAIFVSCGQKCRNCPCNAGKSTRKQGCK